MEKYLSKPQIVEAEIIHRNPDGTPLVWSFRDGAIMGNTEFREKYIPIDEAPENPLSDTERYLLRRRTAENVEMRAVLKDAYHVLYTTYDKTINRDICRRAKKFVTN